MLEKKKSQIYPKSNGTTDKLLLDLERGQCIAYKKLLLKYNFLLLSHATNYNTNCIVIAV